MQPYLFQRRQAPGYAGPGYAKGAWPAALGRFAPRATPAVCKRTSFDEMHMFEEKAKHLIKVVFLLNLIIDSRIVFFSVCTL